MPATRAEAIRALARCVRDGGLDLDGPLRTPDAQSRLLEIRGIGSWTAEYVAMRALREPDAFPAGDLALRRALGPIGKPVSAGDCAQRAEKWRPWRAYAALALWRSEADRAARVSTQR
jgi:AraC family transcriptional regulator of adaptative response / DNA-3-methyladenine glycosylase II